MSNTLTKSEKKLARELIDKGLQHEYKVGIENVGKLVDEWKAEKLDNRAAYIAIFKAVDEYDEHLDWRYNRMSGSKYLPTVKDLYAERIIRENDIAGFTDEVKANIIHYANIRRNYIE